MPITRELIAQRAGSRSDPYALPPSLRVRPRTNPLTKMLVLTLVCCSATQNPSKDIRSHMHREASTPMTNTQNANIGWGRSSDIPEGSIWGFITQALHTFTANGFRKIFVKNCRDPSC